MKGEIKNIVLWLSHFLWVTPFTPSCAIWRYLQIDQIPVTKWCNLSAFLVFLLLTKAGLNCPNLYFDGYVFPTFIWQQWKCQTWIGEKGPHPSPIYWERCQWELFPARWFAMHGSKQSWLQHPVVASFLRKTIAKSFKRFKSNRMSQFTIWDLVSPPLLIRGRWALLSSRTWSIYLPLAKTKLGEHEMISVCICYAMYCICICRTWYILKSKLGEHEIICICICQTWSLSLPLDLEDQTWDELRCLCSLLPDAHVCLPWFKL